MGNPQPISLESHTAEANTLDVKLGVPKAFLRRPPKNNQNLKLYYLRFKNFREVILIHLAHHTISPIREYSRYKTCEAAVIESASACQSDTCGNVFPQLKTISCKPVIFRPSSGLPLRILP